MIIISPIFVYFFSWLLVLFLYSLKLTTNLFPFSWGGVFLISINMFSMIIFFSIFSTGLRKTKVMNNDHYTKIVLSFSKGIFIFWFLGTILEIYYSKGVPLAWIFFGNGKLYTEFGIPSFHGIMNACYLQLVTLLTYLSLKTKRKYYIIFILIILIWPILMLGRGIFLSAIVQAFVVINFFIKIKFKYYFYFGIIALLSIIGFGIVGDIRQNSNPFSYLVIDDYKYIFDNLPSGFLWIYVYLTAGVSNLFYNLPILNPTYTLDYSFSNMLPTIIKTYFRLSNRNDLFLFVDNNLNTSTAYAGFVSDFWILGGFIMTCFIQFLACIAYRLARNGKPWGIFAYTIFFQILLFSVFYDMFFLLPTLFQFIICFSLYTVYHLKNRGIKN